MSLIGPRPVFIEISRSFQNKRVPRKIEFYGEGMNLSVYCDWEYDCQHCLEEQDRGYSEIQLVSLAGSFVCAYSCPTDVYGHVSVRGLGRWCAHGGCTQTLIAGVPGM